LCKGIRPNGLLGVHFRTLGRGGFLEKPSKSQQKKFLGWEVIKVSTHAWIQRKKRNSAPFCFMRRI
jgi:hypothetical protein